MKFLNKKNYIILFLLTVLLIEPKVFAKEIEIQYTKENISNYFSGIISANQDYNNEAFNHLKKVKSLKNRHSQFNIEFIRTLVLLEKFNQAFAFSKSVWSESEIFFEIDLLLGLDYFIKEDYINAEKHFKRLNKISRYNPFFDDFIGNVLIAWSKATQGNEKDSIKFIEKIPKKYHYFKKTQNIFLQCYFNQDNTQISFEQLVDFEIQLLLRCIFYSDVGTQI